MNKTTPLSVMVGKTLREVLQPDDERVTFVVNDHESFNAYHLPDCCEVVRVAFVVGDVADIIGTPIVAAVEDVFENTDPPGVAWPEKHDESYTWTLHKITTKRGEVTFHWLGESNGYYGEGVFFTRV